METSRIMIAARYSTRGALLRWIYIEDTRRRIVLSAGQPFGRPGYAWFTSFRGNSSAVVSKRDSGTRTTGSNAMYSSESSWKTRDSRAATRKNDRSENRKGGGTLRSGRFAGERNSWTVEILLTNLTIEENRIISFYDCIFSVVYLFVRLFVYLFIHRRGNPLKRRRLYIYEMQNCIMI